MGFILERFKIHVVGASILFLSSTFAIVATPAGNHVKQIWNSPSVLNKISNQLDYLTVEVKKATGEDKAILELPGLSYVVEPVYRGDMITLHMVLKRTRTGAGCISEQRTPLFTDETNIATAGKTEIPGQQLGENETQVKLELEVPPQVRSGRVTVYVSYRFSCGAVTLYNTTRPVAFMLLERSQ